MALSTYLVIGVTCPMAGCERRSKRGREELPHIRGQGRKPGGRPRGVTPRPRSGAAAESARLQRCRNGGEEVPKSEVRGGGREDQPHIQGEVRAPLRGHKRAWRSYPTLKVRKGGGEEIPLIEGKEQRLCFAGAALKRYPTTKVRETQVRW